MKPKLLHQQDESVSLFIKKKKKKQDESVSFWLRALEGQKGYVGDMWVNIVQKNIPSLYFY